MPRSATTDARLLLTARSLRGFADGCVSVLLASYLTDIGYSPLEVGAIVTGTLLGSAALTLATGLLANHLTRRRVLLAASLLMVLTGLGFAGITAFWPLLVVAFVGTLNPSSGDVSVFLPTEQALLPDTVSGRERTAIFARYQLGGSLAGALGALASGAPVILAYRLGWDRTQAQRLGFVLYTLIAVAVGFIYSGLSPRVETRNSGPHKAPLAHSRGIVLRLAATFSLDSWGGGFAVQSLLALWLFRRFDLSVGSAGAVFFAAGLLASFSQLLAPHLAARIGLINTMVFTHMPSNVFLVLAAFMPNAPSAVAMLLLRQSMSQMDIAARQTYTMSVVPPEERAAAASVTNVPRSLAAAAAPLMAGALLDRTSFGWPLVCAGSIKLVYDVLLLLQFRSIRPLDEAEPAATSIASTQGYNESQSAGRPADCEPGKELRMATTSVRYDPSASYEFSKRDVEYRRAGGEPLLATVWQPQGPGPFPALLNLHGGAWNSGDRSANPQFSEGLVRSGIVVVSIDFRHGASGPYPDSLVDINYATRWLKAHAAEFNADAATVGGMGVSSGGHLIVLAAMRPNDPRYAADPVPGAEGLDATYQYIIPCWGVLNPYARYLMAKEKGMAELIANHDHYWITAEAMQEGNPVMILQRGERVALPPCLVVHPEKDQWMTVEGAQSFAALYRAAGGQCELAVFKDMPHGIAGWTEERIDEAILRMRTFIAQQLSTVPAAG